MTHRFRRSVALFFVLSLIAVPQSLILAQELESPPAATPIVTTPDPDIGTPDPSDTDNPPDAEDGESIDTPSDPEIPVGTPDSGESTIQSRGTGMGLLAEPTGIYLFYDWGFDGENLTSQLLMAEGFEAAAGNTLTIRYSSDSLLLAPGPYSLPGIPATVTANDATETATITFTDDFVAVPAPGEDYVAVNVALAGTITFPECGPSETGYTNKAEVRLAQMLPDGRWYSQSLFFDGEQCDDSVGPKVNQVIYDPAVGSLIIELEVPETGVTAGTQLTITYPDHLLDVQSAPVGVAAEFLSTDIIGTAVASDGIITITFNDHVPENEMISSLAPVFMDASFNTDAICDPTQESQPEELGRIYFVASSGETFTYEYSTTSNGGFENTILCGSAPASHTAELSEDGTEIHWTLDSGDLINGGTISVSELVAMMTYDCGSILVETVTDNTVATTDCNEGTGNGFSIYLEGEGVTRAIITYTTSIASSALGAEEVYIGCAAIRANGFAAPFSVATSDTHGLGTYVCASVFPPGGGDWISNVASDDTLYPGDELTYQVSFETSTYFWFEISLNDVLPSEGFEVTSVTCAFEPAEMQTGDCEARDDNTISVGLAQTEQMVDDETIEPGPGRITLEITGTVTASPGTELISEACGERSLTIPGLPPILFGGGGSGVLCAATSTQVLQPTEPITLAVTTEDEGSPAGATFEINEVVEDVGAVSFFLAQTPITGTLPANGVVDVGELAIGSSYTVSINGAPAGYQDELVTFEVEEGVGTWNLVLQPLPGDPDPTQTSTPDPTATATPDPTTSATPSPEPTTPATPGSTPTSPADADPTETSAVTGLPETGNGGPSAASALFVATIAAGLLIVAGIGIQLRPRD